MRFFGFFVAKEMFARNYRKAKGSPSARDDALLVFKGMRVDELDATPGPRVSLTLESKLDLQ